MRAISKISREREAGKSRRQKLKHTSHTWVRFVLSPAGVYFCKDGSRLFAVVMTLVCAAFTITTTVLTVIALFTTNLYDMALVPATGQEDYHNIIRGEAAALLIPRSTLNFFAIVFGSKQADVCVSWGELQNKPKDGEHDWHWC